MEILHSEISEFGFHPLKEDKWLPVKSSSSIVSPLASVLAETKFHTLINPNLGVWKQDMVHQLFLPHEALMILGIPLSKRNPPNRIVWAHTPFGLFSTSSAYKLLVSSILAGLADSSNLSPQKQFWKGIWQLRIPNKIKHFIWRASNNELPRMSNLFHQQITSLATCELYKACPEDSLHTLWLCKEVESAWSLFINFHQVNFPP